MALKDTLENDIKKIFNDSWTVRDGQVVPTDQSLKLGNDAIKLNATVLYADLSDSTKLVDNNGALFCAEIYKTFLICAAKIIKDNDGVITAYDGDRIMAVFIGDYKNTSAAKTGLKINYAIKKIVNPLLKEQYPKKNLTINHVVGIDTSEIHAARTGVRGANDIVWVGRAANYAAKLCSLSHDYPTRITEAVYNKMANEAKLSSNGKEMWERRIWTDMDGIPIYRSSWRWEL